MVRLTGCSGSSTFRKGLNFVVSGMVITVVSVAFREELYHVFPVGSPEGLALLMFFVASALVGFGIILTVAGFVGKAEGGAAQNILPQVIILVLLVIVLLALVLMKRDQSFPRSVPSGPVSI